MELINRREREQHAARIATLKEQHARHIEELEQLGPVPVKVKRHPEGEKPKVIKRAGQEVVVMGGNYYTDEGEAFAIAAADLEEGGAWEVVGK